METFLSIGGVGETLISSAADCCTLSKTLNDQRSITDRIMNSAVQSKQGFGVMQAEIDHFGWERLSKSISGKSLSHQLPALETFDPLLMNCQILADGDRELNCSHFRTSLSNRGTSFNFNVESQHEIGGGREPTDRMSDSQIRFDSTLKY